MTIDSGKRVISGTFGELWMDGDLVAECYKFTAKYGMEKEDVHLARQMMADKKVMGLGGLGQLGMYRVFPRFLEIAEQIQAGKDPRFTFVSKLDDPDAYGAERVAIYGVSLDEVPIVNWERKTIVKDEVGFTFTSFKRL